MSQILNKLAAKKPMGSGRVLYLMDKFGVSPGYEPAFAKMVSACGVPRPRIITASIHGLIDRPYVKVGNEKTLRFNPERKTEIQNAVDVRIRAVKPVLIVCSCPLALGLFVNWDSKVATLDKTRGGVYSYMGIPVIVTIPITAIHRNVDETAITNEDGDTVNGEQYQPYKVPQGAWILRRDWEKVGRFYNNAQRRLPEFRYSITRTVADVRAARDWLLKCKLVSVDIETGLFPTVITCIGYTGIQENGMVRTFVVPFYDSNQEDGCFWADDSEHLEAYLYCREINEAPILKTLQNGNYDSSYFIRDNMGLNNYLLDSMLMWYSIYMELPKTLDFISSILLDCYQYWKDDIKGSEEKDEVGNFGLEKYWRYCGLDTYFTLFNTLYLLKVINSSEQAKINYRDVYMRNMSALKMMSRGVLADKSKLAEHRERLQSEVDEAIERLRYLICDPEFNPNSPDQKKALLYDVLGARPRNNKGRFITDASKASSGAIALKAIKTDHPLFKYIIEALEGVMVPDKQMGNITGRTQPDGTVKGGIKFFTDRFRTCYGAAGTTSTRFNSKASNHWDGTNAQNIRASMRDFLVADPGCILVDVDYSQSDDVFMGYESNDAGKIAVIESGVDGHAVHGELFFGMPYDKIVAGKKAGDPKIIHPIYGVRQLSKRIVHGTNFMMAAITLYMTMGRESVVASMKLMGHHDADSWTIEQLVQGCQRMMNAYRKKYPRLSKNEYYKEIAEQLKTTGTLTNAFGIQRKFLGDWRDAGTQREATGFIGQSGTAGNMNRSMYEIDFGWMPEYFRDGRNPDFGDEPRRMDLESHGFRFLLQTHDSFTAQLTLDHPRFEEAVNNLLYVMERPVIINGHTVRVKTEAAFGLRWGKSMIEWSPGKNSLNEVVTQALAA